MGIFLWCIVGVLAILLLGTFRLEVYSLAEKKGTVKLKVYFCGIRIYAALYYISMRHYIFPHIIQIKRNSFRYLSLRVEQKDIRKIMKISPRAFFKGIKRLQAKVVLGVGDAAYTALSCGALETAAWGAIRIWQMPHTELQVLPDFEETGINLLVEGIFCLRVAEIIAIIIKEMRRNYASN